MQLSTALTNSNRLKLPLHRNHRGSHHRAPSLTFCVIFLDQVATVQVQSASMISIEPYEASTLKDVERAILASDLGLTPNNDGAIIRINIPALTTETRQQYVKQAKSIAEDGKVRAPFPDEGS